MDSNDPQQALQQRKQRLAAYLAHDGDNLRLLRDHAGCATQARDFEAALGSLQRIQVLGAALSDDIALTAYCLRALQRIDEAENLLETALQSDPGHAWLQVERAGLLLQRRRFEESIAALPPEVDDPSLAGLAAEYRIRCLHHLGQLDEALAFGESELQKRPDDLRVKACLCPVLCDLGRLEDAAAFARPVLASLGPRYDILETLASVALREGDVHGAGNWVRTALATRQDDGRAWLLDGLVSFRQGRTDDAIPAIERAVALMPGHAGSHLALGWVYLIGQQPARAAEAFHRGTEASPAFAEAWGSQAVAAFALGQREEAAHLARKARLLDRNSPTAQYAELLLAGGSLRDVQALGEQILRGMGAQPMQHQLAASPASSRRTDSPPPDSGTLH